MKTIHCSYPIADCEHSGDIRNAEYEVRKLGGKNMHSYWDGRDCGEAYVEFELDESQVLGVWKRSDKVRYEERLKDYINLGDLGLPKTTDRDSLYKLNSHTTECEQDIKNVRFTIWFKVSKDTENVRDILDECLSIFGIGEECVKASSIEPWEDCVEVNILIECPLEKCSDAKAKMIKGEEFHWAHDCVFGRRDISGGISINHFIRSFDAQKALKNAKKVYYSGGAWHNTEIHDIEDVKDENGMIPEHIAGSRYFNGIAE